MDMVRALEATELEATENVADEWAREALETGRDELRTRGSGIIG